MPLGASCAATAACADGSRKASAIAATTRCPTCPQHSPGTATIAKHAANSSTPAYRIVRRQLALIKAKGRGGLAGGQRKADLLSCSEGSKLRKR